MPVEYANPTPTGMVRLLLADIDPENAVLSDDALAGYLVIESGSIKRAAAQALNAIAISEALVSKVIKTQDLQTNGVALAAELRARAAELRAEAETDEDDAVGFDVIAYNPYPPSVAELTEFPDGGVFVGPDL